MAAPAPSIQHEQPTSISSTMTTSCTASRSVFLAILVAAVELVSYRTFALSTGFTYNVKSSTSFRKVWFSSFNVRTDNYPRHPIKRSTTLFENNSDLEPSPLCDLQTFLRLCNLVDSGGEAKTVIQDSKCLLNGVIETRRGKKLYAGDKVSYLSAVDLNVSAVVEEKGYVYKIKVKKDKPLPKVDEDGNVEFGGRYRSEEWREERKVKKAERKIKNQKSR